MKCKSKYLIMELGLKLKLRDNYEKKYSYKVK